MSIAEKVLQSVPKAEKVCKKVLKCAELCESARKCVKVCESVQKYALLLVKCKVSMLIANNWYLDFFFGVVVV